MQEIYSVWVDRKALFVVHFYSFNQKHKLKEYPEIEFEIDDSSSLFTQMRFIKTTLYQESEGINEGIKSLLEYISMYPSKRVSQIEKALNIPAKTLERWIKQLKNEDKIEYRGSKKSGGYFAK